MLKQLSEKIFMRNECIDESQHSVSKNSEAVWSILCKMFTSEPLRLQVMSGNNHRSDLLSYLKTLFLLHNLSLGPLMMASTVNDGFLRKPFLFQRCPSSFFQIKHSYFQLLPCSQGVATNIYITIL